MRLLPASTLDPFNMSAWWVGGGGGGGAGVFFGWVVFRDGGLVWCLCGVGGFVGLGLLFLQHVETGIERVHGGQSIFLVQYS